MENPDLLVKLTTDASIRRLAGDRYYQRGLDYYRTGRVHSLQRSGNSIRAIVAGTEEYSVRLTAKASGLDHKCDCPLGMDDQFCKHCVATGLEWFHNHRVPAKAGNSSSKTTSGDIVTALKAKDKETLIKLLLDWSEDDEILRKRLQFLVAGEKGGDALVAHIGKSLEKALRIRGYIDYDRMPAYIRRAKQALDEAETLLRHSHTASVIDLYETCIRHLTDAIDSTDDSDGDLSGLIGRLQELHYIACKAVQPDPEQLATRLFFFELHSHYGEWDRAMAEYADLLGEKGTIAYRRAAEAEWAKLPAVTGKEDRYTGPRYKLTSIMESLARQTGDVEQVVAILERDLSHSHKYLRIAELYQNAGKHDKALAWAEQGAAASKGLDGTSLRLFMAKEYQRRERHSDALRIIWLEFRNSLSLSSYTLLHNFALQAEEWDDWREQALSHIRRTIKKSEKEDPGIVWYNRLRNSLLVEIFLYEQNPEGAWQEAQANGCHDQLWLTMAKSREKDHPEDAVPVYLRLGEQAINHGIDTSYKPAIQFLEKAAALMHSMGKSQEFIFTFERLRAKHKLKRNLQKLAEERRKFLYLQ